MSETKILVIKLFGGSANCDSWAKSGVPPVFVNKVLLEYNHAHLLMYCIWLLSHDKGRVEQSSQRP